MLTVFGTVHCSTQQLLEPVNSEVRTRLCLSVKSYEASRNHETEQGVSGKTGLGLVFVRSTKPYFMLFFTSCLLSVLLSTTDKTIACKQSTSTENPVVTHNAASNNFGNSLCQTVPDTTPAHITDSSQISLHKASGQIYND